jgi:hypothetical protein
VFSECALLAASEYVVGTVWCVFALEQSKRQRGQEVGARSQTGKHERGSLRGVFYLRLVRAAMSCCAQSQRTQSHMAIPPGCNLIRSVDFRYIVEYMALVMI